MKISTRVIAKMTVAVFTVVMLGGCKPVMDYFKKTISVSKKNNSILLPTKSEKTGVILLNVDGKPAINEDDFNKHLLQMLQANPYFRGASADSLPKPLKRKFFDELIKQELIIAWAEKNNIDQSSEFQKNFSELIKLVKRSLLVQEYEKKLFEKIKITDDDVKENFNKNKDKYIKEPESVMAQGIEFDNASSASEFLNTLDGREFKIVANAEFKDKYKNFGKITKQPVGYDANIPKAIKDKAFSIKKFPSNEIITVNDKVWVVNFYEKTEQKYFDFNEIKDQLFEMLKGNKFREILNSKVDELRKEFTVDVNEDYFSDEVVDKVDDTDSDETEKEVVSASA